MCDQLKILGGQLRDKKTDKAVELIGRALREKKICKNHASMLLDQALGMKTQDVDAQTPPGDRAKAEAWERSYRTPKKTED
jgi:hypothetical protein